MTPADLATPTADADVVLLIEQLTDPHLDPDLCPVCLWGSLERPDLVWGDRAVAAPFRECTYCDCRIPDDTHPEDF